MPKESPATAAELERRITKVYELLADGNLRRDILRYAHTQTDWNVTDRMIDNYIRRATDILAGELEYFRRAELPRQFAGLNRLIQKAVQEGDMRTELAVRKEVIHLLGLAAPESVNLDVWGKASDSGVKASDLFEALVKVEADEQTAENS